MGASGLVADMEVVGGTLKKDYDVEKWKKAVMEVMEECGKKREVEVGHCDWERGRMEDLFDGWSGRREDGKDRRGERRESRICYACGERGHLRKDCGRTKKDKEFQ